MVPPSDTPPAAPPQVERTLPLRQEAIVPVDDAVPEGLGVGTEGPRYALGATLGAGGMGEVKLCKDTRVGREVAVKLLHANTGSSAEAHARFVREARIQGQLEHPAVVPVYDLGTWSDGATYFTMKRVRGVTLAQVLEALARGDADAAARYTRRRLLTAFTTVCLAVDFAHSRGVLHRDLKPANVMLGEFGEVHVLDWGIAKVVAPPAAGAAAPTLDVRGQAFPTAQGALLGTPGYMSPEQCLGQHDALDARTDVYALGAILFEVLTRHPLHDGESTNKRVWQTLHGAEARARERFPEADVPPELEAACVRATEVEPDRRYDSARALAEAVERYLDGDRDIALRREMADAHAARAGAAAARALAGGDGAEAARGEAMREATRALALAPDHDGALRTVTSLLMEPPATLPAEAQRELEATQSTSRRAAAKLGVTAYIAWILVHPLAFWMGIRSWTSAAVMWSLLGASLVQAAWMWRAGRTEVRHGVFLMLFSSLAIAALSGVAGPFILVPTIAVMNGVLFSMYAAPAQRPAVLVLSALTILLPFGFEALELVDPAYTFRGGEFVVHPRMLFLPPTGTRLFLLVSSLAVVLLPTFLVSRLREDLTAAERRLFMHLWQLRQLVPEPARKLTEAPAPPPKKRARRG